MSVEKAIANRGPLRVHRVDLALSDVEWEKVTADADELGISPDALLSLVCALAARGDWQQASCLALADILQYPYRS